MSKKLLFLICTSAYLLICTSTFAQAPQAFKYQAIARDATGTQLASTNLNVRILLHDLTASGMVVYMETHNVTTNAFGLFSIDIGQGTPSVGAFNTITWGSGSKFIEQEIDFGSGYQSMGTSQLLSVPYALYAENSGAAAASGWLITGNAGTIDGTNFIGTTDNVPFNIRVNNQKAGRIDNTLQNTFLGYQAGNANTTGWRNTANGMYALFSNTTGIANTANGFATLYSNTTGANNTAIGSNALYSNTTGSHNTANGVGALNLNTTGMGNTANGHVALSNNSTGSNNTALGYGANVSTGNLTNATAIGATAIVSASNSLVLGNNANVGIGTSSPTAKLEIAGQIKITGGSPGVGKVLTSDATGLATWATPSGSGGGWSITGNAGTIDGTNFIGTTDNVALNFRVNNQRAGRIDTLGNTFFGYQSGNNSTTGNANTANGYQALFSNTSGIYNTANGTGVLQSNTTGNFNTANGAGALSANTWGYQNTVSGVYTLYSNTVGSQNTANGMYALYSNTTGNGNTANGMHALRFNTIGNSNIAIGIGALFKNTTHSYLVAIGDSALYNNGVGATSFYDAAYNVAVGSKALFANTTGLGNTAIGYLALRNNTIGVSNTANGSLALLNNTVGTQNTANGSTALYYNTTGSYNTATGRSALGNNTTGTSNTATGLMALGSNTTGNLNTADGISALFYNTTGSYNTATGRYALWSNTIGNNNTALGYLAFMGGLAFSNSTALGANSSVAASNQIRLGNSSVSSIGGFANWTNVSDARFKKDISEEVPGLAFITKLRPVTYHMNMDAIASYLKTPDSLRLKDSEALKATMLQTGFIAQEVEKAANELGFDFSGVDKPKNENDYYGLRYAEFVVPLVKGMQEQQEKIDNMQSTIEELKKKNIELSNRLETLERK